MHHRPAGPIAAFVLGIPALVVIGACVHAQRSETVSIDAAPGDATRRLAEFQALAPEHRVTIAGADEPGEGLVVLGTLVRAEDPERALPGARFLLFHADTGGSYDERVEGDDSTARLAAQLTTDERGRFMVSTILPGDYGSTNDNRHIHTLIEGASPESYDLYFAQHINPGLRRWAERSSQAFIVTLQRLDDGRLLGEATLEVRGYPDPRPQ